MTRIRPGRGQVVDFCREIRPDHVVLQVPPLCICVCVCVGARARVFVDVCLVVRQAPPRPRPALILTRRLVTGDMTWRLMTGDATRWLVIGDVIRWLVDVTGNVTRRRVIAAFVGVRPCGPMSRPRRGDCAIVRLVSPV